MKTILPFSLQYAFKKDHYLGIYSATACCSEEA